MRKKLGSQDRQDPAPKKMQGRPDRANLIDISLPFFYTGNDDPERILLREDEVINGQGIYGRNHVAVKRAYAYAKEQGMRVIIINMTIRLTKPFRENDPSNPDEMILCVRQRCRRDLFDAAEKAVIEHGRKLYPKIDRKDLEGWLDATQDPRIPRAIWEEFPSIWMAIFPCPTPYSQKPINVAYIKDASYISDLSVPHHKDIKVEIKPN